MITNNFEKILRFFPNAVINNAASNVHDGIPIIDVNGNTVYVRPNLEQQCLPAFIIRTVGSGNNATAGWRFGTGTTPPTKNDYCMENPIASGISLNADGGTLVLDGDTYKTLYKLTVQNTSSNDITISEIGYIGRSYGSSAQKQNAPAVGILFMREVYNEPIIIHSNESIVLNAYIETPIG